VAFAPGQVQAMNMGEIRHKAVQDYPLDTNTYSCHPPRESVTDFLNSAEPAHHRSTHVQGACKKGCGL